MKQKFSTSQGSEGMVSTVAHERSPSDLSLEQQEGDVSLTDMPEGAQHPHRVSPTHEPFCVGQGSVSLVIYMG